MRAPSSFPAIDADLPGLLARLHQHHTAGDGAGTEACLAQIGPQRAAAAATLVGALCIGGADLAVRVVTTAYPNASSDECTALVLDAFGQVVDAPDGAAPDHELQIACWLVEAFALTTPASALLDIVRAEFLIDCGPLSEVPQAVQGAMCHQQWALSLRGLERIRHSLGSGTPRGTYGLAATCLHQLGRYAEADTWIEDGLGDDRNLLAIAPVHTERQLLAKWGAQEKPVISIVCTTYNHERYIESAIRGFLSQDCSFPFEILIHDDASTDHTQEVIRRWQQRYPKLIKPILQTENQKSQGVRPFELLLAQARGDYVATCEGDDFWVDPAKLQKQVGYLMAHPEVACSAHNYYHFVESKLSVKVWNRNAQNLLLSQQQLMSSQCLLWLPTLVFRKTFSALPPERALAAFGDQFLTSFLGTQGPCAYFNSLIGAVRRENEFSSWSPLPEAEKERRRVKTWAAIVRLHQRLGNAQAADALSAKIHASKLDAHLKASILNDAARFQPSTLAAA